MTRFQVRFVRAVHSFTLFALAAVSLAANGKIASAITWSATACAAMGLTAICAFGAVWFGKRRGLVLLSVLVLACCSHPAAAVYYAQDFETDVSSSWKVNKTAGIDATTNFTFDYSTAGIPAAPSGTGTHGLKMGANATAHILGGVSASPKGQAFGNYVITFDWWANFPAPYPISPDGSTQLSTFGVGTAGTRVQADGGVHDSVWFAATGDGNTTFDWRAYRPGGRYSETSGVYSAGAHLGSENASDPFYANFGSVPLAGGTTNPGSAGMEWHSVEITKTSTSVKWKVDGKTIAKAPISSLKLGGSNFFLGHSDINSTVAPNPSTSANTYSVYDNVVVQKSLGYGDGQLKIEPNGIVSARFNDESPWVRNDMGSHPYDLIEAKYQIKQAEESAGNFVVSNNGGTVSAWNKDTQQWKNTTSLGGFQGSTPQYRIEALVPSAGNFAAVNNHGQISAWNHDGSQWHEYNFGLSNNNFPQQASIKQAVGANGNFAAHNGERRVVAWNKFTNDWTDFSFGVNGDFHNITPVNSDFVVSTTNINLFGVWDHDTSLWSSASSLSAAVTMLTGNVPQFKSFNAPTSATPWSSGSNWESGTEPTVSSQLSLTNSTNHNSEVVVDTAANAYSLNVNGGANAMRLAVAPGGNLNVLDGINVGSGGELHVMNDGVLQTSQINVAAGGKLGGSGAVNAAIMIAGTLAPGASIESLTVDGDASLLDGATFEWEVDTAIVAADLLDISGVLNLFGDVTLSILQQDSDLVQPGTKLSLIRYAKDGWNGGTFSGLANNSMLMIGGNQFKLRYDDITGGANFDGSELSTGSHYVTLTAVPEASAFLTISLGGIFAIAAVCLSKRAGISLLKI